MEQQNKVISFLAGTWQKITGNTPTVENTPTIGNNMEQQYKVINFITGVPEFFLVEADAVARAEEITAYIMEVQAARFNIIYVEKLAQGENWTTVTEESPEDGTYRVFISETGLHETYTSKTEAFARNQALKDAFKATITQVPVLADPQPTTTGTQEL
jgi:hypothetical protein